MPWAKIDDQAHRKRKIRRLSDSAWRLYFSAIYDCCAEMSSGLIEGWALRELLPHHHEDYVTELVNAGLLHAVPGCQSPRCLGSEGLPLADSDSYVVHNHAGRQMTEEEWNHYQAQQGKKGRFGMHKRWHVERGIQSPDCEFCQTET